MIPYQIKIPNTTNRFVSELSTKLGLSPSPIILDTIPGPDDEVCACFINVQKKVEKEGGTSVLGWQFWEYPYMVAAEFHAVWRSPDGKLIDITPKDDDYIRQILFVEDTTRTYNGTQTDNVRLNITTCGLIDDLIEVEKAQFRFMNIEGRNKIVGPVHLEGEDARVWYTLVGLHKNLEHLHLTGGDINFPCYCNSGKAYKDCHREKTRLAMVEIQRL